MAKEKMRKTAFIEQLREGDRVDDLFLVKTARLGETRAGKPYLTLTVMDRTGELGGPIWDDAERAAQVVQPGLFVRISGQVGSYRDALQLRIDGIVPVPKEQVEIADFVAASRHDLGSMTDALHKLCRSLEEPFLKQLLLEMFGNNGLADRFAQAPAAKGIHHAYVGGLIEHALSMARVADMLAAHYPGVNRSLLIAGVLLHDVGKVEELSVENGVIDYSDAGRLKGHLVIGSEMVASAAARIKGFPRELLIKLQHLILSHHGRQEFGSPTVPMTVEAFLLNYVDELDSRMNMLEQLRRRQNSEGMAWSEYQRTLERYLYLDRLSDEGGDSAPAPEPVPRPKKMKKAESDAAARQQSLF